MIHNQIDDLTREGINWVTSFMGHLQVEAADPNRLRSAAAVVATLTDKGLAAASGHVRMCLDELDAVVTESKLPDNEKCDYRYRRLAALLIAEGAVWQEFKSRSLVNTEKSEDLLGEPASLSSEASVPGRATGV